MKTTLTTLALILAASAAAADTTDAVTGCATKPVANTNALQFTDPTCPQDWAVRTGNTGSSDPTLATGPVNGPWLDGREDPGEPEGEPAT